MHTHNNKKEIKNVNYHEIICEEKKRCFGNWILIAMAFVLMGTCKIQRHVEAEQVLPRIIST